MKKSTLLEYLLNEVILDVDSTDPDAILGVRQRANRANQNPERVKREQIKKSREELKTAQQSEQSPTKQIDIQIARKKQELATLTTKREQIKKRNQNESVETPEDICEVVYTNESGDVVHSGSILTESSMKAYVNAGNVIKRQFRCTSGKKEGKIVTKPSDCNVRPNPNRVKAGKKSAKKSKSVRIHKTKIAKHKSISKMVTSLNARLKDK